jgi:hypothetical protein
MGAYTEWDRVHIKLDSMLQRQNRKTTEARQKGHRKATEQGRQDSNPILAQPTNHHYAMYPKTNCA